MLSTSISRHSRRMFGLDVVALRFAFQNNSHYSNYHTLQLGATAWRRGGLGLCHQPSLPSPSRLLHAQLSNSAVALGDKIVELVAMERASPPETNLPRAIKRKDSPSKYLGVYLARRKYQNKWRAYVRLENQQRLHLGFFDNEWEAAKAYNDAVIKHGLSQKLNVESPDNRPSDKIKPDAAVSENKNLDATLLNFSSAKNDSSHPALPNSKSASIEQNKNSNSSSHISHDSNIGSSSRSMKKLREDLTNVFKKPMGDADSLLATTILDPFTTASAAAATSSTASAEVPTSKMNSTSPNLVGLSEEVINALNKLGKEALSDPEILESARLHGSKFARQIEMESIQERLSTEEFKDTLKDIAKAGRMTDMKRFQKKLKNWFVPLSSELESEIKLISMGVSGQNRKQYSGPLLLLPVETIAVICLKSTLTLIMRSGNRGASVTQLAIAIADQVELEVGVLKLSMSSTKQQLKPWENAIIDTLNKESKNSPQKKTHRAIIMKLRKLMSDEHWDLDTKVKLGAFVLKILLETAKYNGENAFNHDYLYSPGKKKGIIKMNEDLFLEFSDLNGHIVTPKYFPMIVPPLRWDSKRPQKSVQFLLRTNLMRHRSIHSKHGSELLKRANFPKLLEALDFLGQIPWVISKPVADVIKVLYFDRKQTVGELPSHDSIALPMEQDFFHNVVKADPLTGEQIEIREFNKRQFNAMRYKVKTRNAELHSLRCEVEIRLNIIDKFRDEKFYFPCNLDFRGRVYPLSPNFSHLGSDLCRGVLRFSDGKPLGEKGLYWLKVHLANLFGNNKIMFEERAAWVDKHMSEVFDSATNPLDGNRWWASAESPFQALSTCLEIKAALDSNDPASFISNLPVHADGSCNGLQHYAALGKDLLGGAAVNLTNSEIPQDVYSRVLEEVRKRVAEDALISETDENPVQQKKRECAVALKSIVSRKVIKQTVMTSVYGVTLTGARDQIKNRLFEIFYPDKSYIMTNDQEALLNKQSDYMAQVTLTSLSELFKGANAIMGWLANAAVVVGQQDQAMSWRTPLGMPVIQPYRRYNKYCIKTVMQSMYFFETSDDIPVSRKRQRSAFSPNFVHSLDSTHMLMTALKMKEASLSFASVHDSYWTHACSIDDMAKLLRMCFVELYSQPVLENLRDSLIIRYPELTFPPLPERGDLDIKNVLNSKFFFH